jgi:soluble lytic murein transglycosylase
LTLKKMGRMRKYIRKNAEPYFLFGYGLVLKSADEDLKAAKVFHRIAHRYPDHHLAVKASLEAGRLLSDRGQEAEGLGAYQRAIQMAPRGPSHRSGLWEVGFASLLSGGYKRAEVLMGDLVLRYGGEREALGILWAEKAGYWQARASELDGKLEVAALRYRRLIANFPLSWYALWSQKRLDALLVTGRVHAIPPWKSSVGMRVFEGDWADLKIVQRPALDAPVALLKLGFLVQARRALESMLAAGELPGSGRLLLAALHHRSGRTARAKRLIRRGGVLVAAPERADADLFEAMFPGEYRELVGKVSADLKLPVSVAAGLVRVESRFNPRARSGAGATGLTQLMPKTARAVGRRLLGMRWVGRRMLRQPETNLKIGLRYLKELDEHFQGHMPLALAAYNAGIGAARSWWRKLPRPTTDVFVEKIPYPQTRNYVRRVYSSAFTYTRLYGGDGPVLPLALPETLGPYFEEK